VPLMVVVPETVFAEPSEGLFYRPLGPVSASPGSFAVGSLEPRSVPRPPFEKTVLERMELPLAVPGGPRRRPHALLAVAEGL
jgi:hypothetical protein